MFVTCDSKNSPCCIGKDNNTVIVTSEVCGINEVLPNRNTSSDIYPNERETVVINNDLRIERWKQ